MPGYSLNGRQTGRAVYVETRNVKLLFMYTSDVFFSVISFRHNYIHLYYDLFYSKR